MQTKLDKNAITLSFGHARLGPKTTARFAAVILFMSHLNNQEM